MYEWCSSFGSETEPGFTNIKLSLPINNTLTSDNIKVATDKGWIVVNINNKSNAETTSNNENEGGVVSE